MTNRAAILLLMGCLLTAAVPAYALQSLSNWIDEDVAYIASDREKQQFRSLASESRRQQFIEAFWKLRDPTPGTEANEFRDEHYRRIDEANRAHGSGRTEGWRTDMGRVYIILGDPIEERVFRDPALNGNVYAWYYPPDKSCGLRYYYYIVFFRPDRQGEHIIYSPKNHGPAALVRSTSQGRQDSDPDSKALNLMLKIDRLLGQLSLSLLPREHSPIMIDNSAELRRALGKRSGASEKTVDLVLESRNYRQDEMIKKLESILHDGGETTGDVNYQPVRFSGSYGFHVLRCEGSGPMLHYSFVAERGDIGLNDYRGRCYAVLKVTTEARNSEGALVRSKTETVTANFGPHELGQGGAVAVVYEGAMALARGIYNVRVTVNDLVYRRAFFIDREVEIPDRIVREMTFGAAFFVAAEEEVGVDCVEGETPYLIYGRRYVPNVAGLLLMGSKTELYMQLYLSAQERISDVTVGYEIISRGRVYWRTHERLDNTMMKAGKILSKSIEIPSDRLRPGSYTFRISASKTSPPVPSIEIPFVVSASPNPLALPKLVHKTE